MKFLSNCLLLLNNDFCVLAEFYFRVQFKMHCFKVALEKIWLTAIKVCNEVTDDLVSELHCGVIVPTSEHL